MQGILVMDKPAGFTSFDVDAKLRGILGTRKIGHAGTLDPMATGVLPVFVGRAAKAVDMLPDTDKTYEATLRLGLRTNTGDITGQVLETAPVPAGLDETALCAVLGRFLGRSMQTPPMYSAVKVGGQPLYKLARKGKTVARPARPIVIHTLQLLGRESQTDFRLRIVCGKGTYVRVLLEDIGRALRVPATMAALRRTASGPYTLEMAYTLDELQRAREAGTLESLLLSVESVFTCLPAVEVNEETRRRLLNGAPTYRFPARDGRYRALCEGEFLGVCRVEKHILTVEKLFCERA